ncbi:MAG TPA: glycoside hydrolase family 2 protein, partial [Acetobacteraceae bacterium]|nr:glycoside hydrolase family 2 protein [Acetobacteraceae bacterium]
MTDGWYLTCLPAGAARHPATLPSGAEWTPAIVPGTAAPALIRAGMPVPDLDRQDVWYRCSLPPGPRGRRLRFNGLATLTEAWLDDVPLLVGDSMFVAQERPMPQGTEGGATLHLRFRALESPKGLPRARWRPKLAEPGFLRGIRTTLLGRMPGSAPAPAPVGPYGGVDLLMPRGDLPRFGRARIATQLDSAGTGHLSVRLPILEGDLPQASACVVQVGGRTAPLTRSGNVLEGEIALPRIA